MTRFSRITEYHDDELRSTCLYAAPIDARAAIARAPFLSAGESFAPNASARSAIGDVTMAR